MNIVKQIRKMTNFEPEVACVLGTGLGDFAKNITVVDTIDYKQIKGFPVSTVDSHEGRFVFGYLDDVKVVIMQGRVHYYEGYSISDVVLPIRVMKMLGAKYLFLTNAAGGINEEFTPGDFMLINDHISDFVPSPLIGKNDDELGIRFPAMDEVYDREMQSMVKDVAKENDIDLKEGVYIQLTGPNFETPAEIRMCKAIGADAVGMSTVVEAIAAKHMGMRICGVSCISNMACGISSKPLSHTEVGETTKRVAESFEKLMKESILKVKTLK